MVVSESSNGPYDQITELSVQHLVLSWTKHASGELSLEENMDHN